MVLILFFPSYYLLFFRKKIKKCETLIYEIDIKKFI